MPFPRWPVKPTTKRWGNFELRLPAVKCNGSTLSWINLWQALLSLIFSQVTISYAAGWISKHQLSGTSTLWVPWKPSVEVFFQDGGNHTSRPLNQGDGSAFVDTFWLDIYSIDICGYVCDFQPCLRFGSVSNVFFGSDHILGSNPTIPQRNKEDGHPRIPLFSFRDDVMGSVTS